MFKKAFKPQSSTQKCSQHLLSTPSAAFHQHNKSPQIEMEPFSLFEGASDDEMEAFWKVVL